MKIVVGITGASGAIYADTLLQDLKQSTDKVDVSVVMSDAAKQVWEYELNKKVEEVMPFQLLDFRDFFSAPASGSAGYDGMIICPCSMGTLAKIATGLADNLLCRAADVMLKERQPLLVAVRETPYNLIHIENMRRLTLAGGTIVPCSPSYYSHPVTQQEIARTVTHRLLKLLNISINDSFKWGNHHGNS